MDEHAKKNHEINCQSLVFGPPAHSVIRIRKAGRLMFVTACLSSETGRVGVDTTPGQAAKAGKELARKLLEALKDELGSLNQIRQFVKMLGLVRSGNDFDGMPLVMNGFSEVLTGELGERGYHARSAVGVTDLPGRALLSVSMILEVKEIAYDY